MFGLVDFMTNFSMIVTGSNMGVSKMTRKYLGDQDDKGASWNLVGSWCAPLHRYYQDGPSTEEKYQETLKVLKKFFNLLSPVRIL